MISLSALLSLETVFVASGIVLAVFAAFTALDRDHPKRFGTAAFWLLLGVVFALGSVMPGTVTGILVVCMVLLDVLGLVGHASHAERPAAEIARSADRLGGWLFLPVLMIPIVTYGASLAFSGSGVDANRLLYVSLGSASILAAAVALAVTRSEPVALVHEGRRLADAIGAVVILPQLLAALGRIYKDAGVGDVIAFAVKSVVPTDSLLAVVVALCATIALFTFVMGNSFVAFPVIMAGIGAPLLIGPFGADPAVVGAVAMTAASCGTLCTPMAANFNLVPPALFEMRDKFGVIRFQAPFAAAIFVVHVAVLYVAISLARSAP